ncbi:PEPxxWA-CTERM sorting domain-containing protein [Sphingomonas tabacisoli]|uniref:PEPxxWA-CTERM sorting domain-containing protein n=1 Tax=Sphingomonas tabacisoli TaxID=2249466 RepID=A0ABW4I5P5_9SPHN
MSRSKTVAVALACIAASPASAALLYSNNFDGAVSVAPGVGVAGPTTSTLEAAAVGAWNANGWVGQYADNRTQGNPATATVLTLTNIPAHTQVSVAFLLGLLESWDSLQGNDFFRVQADGVDLVSGITTNNASGSTEFYAGGTRLFKGVQLNGNTFFSDTLVDMSTAAGLTFAHSAPTLTLSFQTYGVGWQGGSDEGWGMDNLVINFTPSGVAGVPEPASWAMMIGGFGLAGMAMRRRRVAFA